MRINKIEEGFNPFRPEFQANPYPTYQRLRLNDPVHQTPSFSGAWLLTRYADVKMLLNDPRVEIDNLPQRLEEKRPYLEQGKSFTHLSQSISSWLFFLNPPDHTRFRSLVTKAFSITEIENIRPCVEKIVNQLIEKVQLKGTMDIMADIASPLPALVISEILGIPSEDRQGKLIQWSYTLFRVFDQPLSLKQYASMEEIALAFKKYFRDLIQQRERQLGSDLLSQIIIYRDQQNISEEELLGFCAMLFSVGQETTENMIGNSMLALLTHPNHLEQLKQNPTLIKDALEELLRYDSPVPMVVRIAKEDIELEGKTIKKGDRIYLALGAANRDPSQFVEPDHLNFTRHKVQPIPFGSGIHLCLGMALARIQGQIAINTMIQHLPNLQLTNEPLKWRKTIAVRGLKALSVTF